MFQMGRNERKEFFVKFAEQSGNHLLSGRQEVNLNEFIVFFCFC